MVTDDGGPAFPVPEDDWNKTWSGMSLRDYFAGQALTGLLVSMCPESSEQQRHLAVRLYEMADAMIAARKGSDPNA